jgi:hypothetical protein
VEIFSPADGIRFIVALWPQFGNPTQTGQSVFLVLGFELRLHALSSLSSFYLPDRRINSFQLNVKIIRSLELKLSSSIISS